MGIKKVQINVPYEVDGASLTYTKQNGLQGYSIFIKPFVGVSKTFEHHLFSLVIRKHNGFSGDYLQFTLYGQPDDCGCIRSNFTSMQFEAVLNFKKPLVCDNSKFSKSPTNLPLLATSSHGGTK